MGEARSLLKRPTGASFIQVNLYDKDRPPQDAAQIEATLQYSAASWQEREKSWLEVFRALRISTAITVSVFTLIAGLAMFNTLAMIVMEKTKEIAILRSMGYTRGDISRIFLWQAAIVLMLGTVVGWVLGAVGTYVISNLPIRIQGIFTMDTYIVNWSVWITWRRRLVCNTARCQTFRAGRTPRKHSHRELTLLIEFVRWRWNLPRCK